MSVPATQTHNLSLKKNIGNSVEKNNNYRTQLLDRRILEKRIGEAVVFLRQNNIEPILIKGWAAARFYPNKIDRQFGDVDLTVSPAKYQNALKVLEGYKNKDLIDLHEGVRHLDSLSFEDLYSNSILIECYDQEIRILRPEDHLRVLCVHWLTDGGAYKDRLWDIFYAIENRPADFDWDRCVNTVSATRRKWIVCAIGIAHTYLGLDLSDTPLADEAREIPRWLIKAVEREWESNIKLMSLDQFLDDRRELWRQIKKRFPPNPIQSTVNMEGEFDNSPRIIYQIPDIFMRLKPSLKRILKTISNIRFKDEAV